MLLDTRALLIPEKGLLKSLSEFTGFGSVILDQNFTILHFSREIKTLLLYEEKELIGRNCLSLCPESDREGFRQFLADLNQEGVSDGRIWPLEPKTGDHVSCQVKGMCLETSNGEPLYLLSLTDMGPEETSADEWRDEAETCLVRESALYTSEERYRHIFEMCPDMILVHWPAHEYFLGEPMEVNQAACDRLHYTREELLMGDTPILSEEDQSHIVDIRKQLFKKKALVFQVRLRAKTGRIIPFEFHSRYYEIEGQPMIMSVAREIIHRDFDRIRGLHPEDTFEKYEIWNEKEGLWRVDNDRELFAELAEVFFRGHQNLFDNLKQAMAENDIETVTKLAHSYKGSAGNLSATKIQKISEYMEKNSRAGQMDKISGMLPQLELETERFKALLIDKGLLSLSKSTV